MGPFSFSHRAASPPPWVSLPPKAVVCSSLRGSPGWRRLQSPSPSTLSPAALHNSHFAPAAPPECMWAMWDTGKMVSMATRTSEMPARKFALGENILLRLHVAKEGQRWAGCSSTPENKNIPGGLGCAVLGLFPAWAGWDICDKATPSHYLQSCWFSPKRPKGELWGARCCSGLLTPLALDRTGVKLSPFLPWSWTALQMLAIVPPFL